jgi:hypothetical protein
LAFCGSMCKKRFLSGSNNKKTYSSGSMISGSRGNTST